jgi:hypothetical protein
MTPEQNSGKNIKMDIRQTLLAEHSKRQTMKIVRFIGEDAEKFKELVEIFLTEEYRLAQRSAWAVNYCAQLNPKLVEPYLEKMLDQLERGDVHDAVKRNVVRLLQYVVIPEELLGRVYTHCFDLVDDSESPVAVRVFALSVATNIAKAEPDLQRELQLVVKKHLPYSTAAFHKRARAILSVQ